MTTRTIRSGRASSGPSLDQQASYIIQAMAMAVAAGVERYAVYKATDEKAENDTELWGLIRNNGTTKPATWRSRSARPTSQT